MKHSSTFFCKCITVIILLVGLIFTAGCDSNDSIWGTQTCSPSPRITSTPPQYATVGYWYTYPIQAKYVCSSTILYGYCNDVYGVLMPAGTEIDTYKNYLTWTPSASHANKNILFTIATEPDICGNQVSQSWTVHVYEPPFIENFTAEKTFISPGESTLLTAIFEGSGIIEGLGSITSGVPLETQALSTTTDFKLIVTNSVGAEVTQSLTIVVLAPPVIQSLKALPSIDANGTTTAEREALIAIYHSTDGPNWIDNSGWLGEEGTECSWGGVSCDENSHITHLSLSYNGLTGNIPPQIRDLVHLMWLSLMGNQLTGSIPPEIGDLAYLEWLLLEENQLTGSIPPEIGNLINLFTLSLNNNQLTGSIPPEIGNLINLHNSLMLSNNQLSGSIPPEIGNLINTMGLYLDNNQLTGDIPSEIGNITSISFVNLKNNKLTGSIPSTFTGLTNLHWVDVTGNCLTNFDSLINVMSKWGPPVLYGADAQRCSSGLPWLMLLLD